MRWSFAAVGVIVAGLIGITIILLFQQITTNNESDYYLLKEITEAAMIESVDINHYRTHGGELKISREKFVENFTRRFAESTNLTGTGYTLNFFDIMETPPKVSIIINTGLGQYKIFEDTSDYNVQNRLDAILEYVSKDESVRNSENPYSQETISKPYYYITNNKNLTFLSIKIPEELNVTNITNIKIKNVSLIELNKSNFTEGDFNKALLEQDLYYNKYPESNLPDISNFYFSDYNDFVKIDQIETLKYCNSAISCNNENCDCNGKPTPTNGEHLYWIKLKRKEDSKYKNTAVLKFQIEWSYDEYKYS